MDAVNLRGWDMTKRRRSHRELRPETGTALRTRVKSGRTFMVGDAVAWAPEGAPRVNATIMSFTEDDHWAVVRAEDGCVLAWPCAEIRYAQTPHYADPEPSIRTPTPTGITPIGDPLPIASDYYESVDLEVAEETQRTVVDLADFDGTLPDGHMPTRRGR